MRIFVQRLAYTQKAVTLPHSNSFFFYSNNTNLAVIRQSKVLLPCGSGMIEQQKN